MKIVIVYRLIIFFFISVSCWNDAYSFQEQKTQVDKQSGVTSSNNYNVIIIAISTLRPDHLGCYGYKRQTSPNIDKLAYNGIVFTQAISQSNWTLPSITSLFTSKYVRAHTINSRDQRTGNDELMLAEILKIYGYKTAAFTGGLDLKSVYNLDQGFDVYSDSVAVGSMGGWRESMAYALDWIINNKDNKFFLFLHTYDVHQPYHYPEPYDHMYDQNYTGVISRLFLDYSFLKKIKNYNTFLDKDSSQKIKLSKRDIDYIISKYDTGITYADSYIGRLLTVLKKNTLNDKTIIIITADHGEALDDHGSFDRYGSNNLYDEVVRVPLILKHPGLSMKGRIDAQVKSIDVMPTVLGSLSIPVNAEAQGLNLLPLIKRDGNENFNRYVFSEGRGKKWSLRSKKWKLIYDKGTFELYNLEKDFREQNNLSKTYPDVVYELYQKYLEWHKTVKRKNTLADNRIILSEEAIKDLKDAGYW